MDVVTIRVTFQMSAYWLSRDTHMSERTVGRQRVGLTECRKTW